MDNYFVDDDGGDGDYDLRIARKDSERFNDAIKTSMFHSILGDNNEGDDNELVDGPSRWNLNQFNHSGLEEIVSRICDLESIFE
ncbi:pyrroline-5-carboxylate reductase 3 [Sarcoptes scabiei]|nr:pyrroline-5-carboxylate reductase 3 [Sarcoptes scabiei]